MENSGRMSILELNNEFRKLWQEHVMWTRFFIVSTANSLGDLPYVTDRLLRNPGDFAKVFMQFYTMGQAEGFKKLFKDHLIIAADLVNAAKKGDTAAVKQKREEWYKNADEIAAFLASINPHWSEEEWKKMMHDHLAMTEREATQILGGKYPDSIKEFDMIEDQAMQMADMMTRGIVRQFYMGRD